MLSFQVGDRIVTPNGRTRTIAPSPYSMPVYLFVNFDDGTQFFVLKNILKPHETSCTNRSKSTRNRRSLEKVGASVQPLHTVHEGVPDLLVGYQGRNFLLEVKDGTKPPSARKLTPCQVSWHDDWAGQTAVVVSAEEAIAVIVQNQVSYHGSCDD